MLVGKRSSTKECFKESKLPVLLDLPIPTPLT